MAPIHHHFEKLGWPESKVVTRFWIVRRALRDGRPEHPQDPIDGDGFQADYAFYAFRQGGISWRH